MNNLLSVAEGLTNSALSGYLRLIFLEEVTKENKKQYKITMYRFYDGTDKAYREDGSKNYIEISKSFNVEEFFDKENIFKQDIYVKVINCFVPIIKEMVFKIMQKSFEPLKK